MTGTERFGAVCKLVAEINPELSVADVLARAADLLAIAGPQPRAKKATKPARTPRVEKTEAA